MRSYLPERRIAYPLKTFDGALDGMVTLNRLAQVPVEERHTKRVRDVGTGMDDVAKASPASASPRPSGKSAMSVITTNCKPIRAPAEEPTIT